MNRPASLPEPRGAVARLTPVGGAVGPHVTEFGAAGMRAPPPPESGIIDAATRIGRLLLKQMRLILICLALGLVLGAAVTLLTPAAYTARAVVQIDRQNERVVGNEDQTPIDNYSEEFFQTQYGLLRSRSLAARVADSLGLASDDTFRDTMSGKPRSYVWPAVDDRRTMAVDLVEGGLVISPQRGSRLVDIEFKSPDPRLSAKVANSFAENFIGSAIDRRYESSSYARDFLEKQLAQVKAKLEESERELVTYAASQQIIQLPGSGGQPNGPDTGPSLPATNLEAFNTALTAARTERIKAEEKWRAAQSAGVGLSEILQSPTYQALSQEHAKMVAEYQDKLRIFKPDYPDLVQLKARVDETARQLALEAESIRQSLKTQYESALASEKALQGQVESLKTSVLDLRGRSIRYNILQREVDTNRTLYDGLLQRYKEVGVAGGVSANNISIIDRAQPPDSPSQPRPLFDLALGAMGGLLVGVMAAILREAFDQAVRSPQDLEEGHSLAVLGAVPRLPRRTTPAEALADARSPMAEAFQTVRSALQFSTPDGFPKTLLITSPWPGSGKTTTALALAQYVARLGFRILLVEADLRNPALAKLVGARGGLGLSSLLVGAAPLQEAVQATSFENLYIIAAGPSAPNPADLLGSGRLPGMIAEAQALFDMVIFDGPPVMDLADAPIIGAAVEGSILVVEAGKTSQRQVKEAMRRMMMSGAHVLGAVLNKATRGTGGEYGYGASYGYGYGYGAPDAKNPALVLRLARRLLPR